METNQKIQESNLQLVEQSATNAEAMFGSLAMIAKNRSGETSAAYREMFAIQKAFAIASIEASMAVGIGKAVELGWPAGIPAAIGAAAEGARAMAMLSDTSFSGAHDLGGRIPAGSVGLVGERGPELVRGPADVTSRMETARMLNGGAGGGGGPNVSVNLHMADALHSSFDNYLSSDRGSKTLNVHIKKNWRTIQALRG